MTPRLEKFIPMQLYMYIQLTPEHPVVDKVMGQLASFLTLDDEWVFHELDTGMLQQMKYSHIGIGLIKHDLEIIPGEEKLLWIHVVAPGNLMMLNFIW